jgi:hypothetical protein
MWFFLGGGGEVCEREAAMGGAQRPVFPVNEPKKDGCAQRTRGQNPLVKRKVWRSSDSSAPCTCTVGAILNLGSAVLTLRRQQCRLGASANVQE